MALPPPQDEIQWCSPRHIAEMGGIHSNTILFYFAESPFFDRTSNNQTVYTQAFFTQSLHLLETREAFEGRLRTMAGLEFMVAHAPADMVSGTGVWVIRKQHRQLRQGMEPVLTLLSTYFVVGDNIYMAPSLGDVLSSRSVRLLPLPLLIKLQIC
jgi:mediator of RNA polymerase II transcription subunit 6